MNADKTSILFVQTTKYNYYHSDKMLNNSSPFPRQKQYISNLSSLLDTYQAKSSQFINTHRSDIHTHSQKRPKTMNLQRFTLTDVNNPIFKPLNIRSNGEVLHTRSVSNFVGRYSGNSPEIKTAKNAQQQRKQKMINMLSTQNFRKQLMNTRKMSAVQAQYRSNESKNKQRKKQYDLRFNVLKNNYELYTESNSKGESQQSTRNKPQKQEQQNPIQKSLSLQLKQQKKQYLRKNTSINKSILNTIIKLKLARQNSQQEAVNNEQIVKMIKVYKGIEPISTISKGSVELSVSKQYGNGSGGKKEAKDPLNLDGWQNDTEDFDFNRSHSPQPAEVLRL